MYTQVFSEYEVNQIGIIMQGESTGITNECVGSAEESMNAKTVVKKCKGVETKSRTKGDGTGEVKLSLHIEYDAYTQMFGMNVEGLKTGVKAYGEHSSHKVFCLTEKILDEDGVTKFKAYPSCQIKEGMSRKTENGADEIAEVELTIAVMPDDYGYGVYEAIESELDDNDLKTKWMTAFEPDMAQAESL